VKTIAVTSALSSHSFERENKEVRSLIAYLSVKDFIKNTTQKRATSPLERTTMDEFQ